MTTPGLTYVYSAHLDYTPRRTAEVEVVLRYDIPQPGKDVGLEELLHNLMRAGVENGQLKASISTQDLALWFLTNVQKMSGHVYYATVTEGRRDVTLFMPSTADKAWQEDS